MRPGDDQEALEEKRAELQQRLADVSLKADELQRAKERRAELEGELAELDARLAHRKKRRLSLLDDIRIASPCKASWDEMTGDDRVRFCGSCEKNVYNLSAMTRDEAETLLAAREGSICVRIYQRADGTVLTTDCPEGVRRRRRRTAFAVAGAGAMAASAAFAGWAMRKPAVPGVPTPIAVASPAETSAVMGAPTATPTATTEPTTTYMVTAGAIPPPERPRMGRAAFPRDPTKPGKVTVPKRPTR